MIQVAVGSDNRKGKLCDFIHEIFQASKADTCVNENGFPGSYREKTVGLGRVSNRENAGHNFF